MKAFAMITKVLTALAAVAGVIYIIATYGDKIVAWAKNLLGRDACEDCDCNVDGECTCECECNDCDCCDCERDECECECECEEEATEETVEETEEAPAAEEADFEG